LPVQCEGAGQCWLNGENLLDLLTRGGTVVDGSGGARCAADVGVAQGRIASVGRITARAAREADACALIVAPGFVEGHTHMDARVMQQHGRIGR